jgi:hypothetical protein
MNRERVLRTIATELPVVLRQVGSANVTLHLAAIQRLHDWVQMTEPWRRGQFAAHRAGTTFAAMTTGVDKE